MNKGCNESGWQLGEQSVEAIVSFLERTCGETRTWKMEGEGGGEANIANGWMGITWTS